MSRSSPFLTKFGQAIGSRGIQRLLGKYLTEVGITRASVHTLRHTFATHHVAQGTSLRTVQEVLGHSRLKTPPIYVQLAQEAVRRELQEHALIQDFPPVPHLTPQEDGIELPIVIHK